MARKQPIFGFDEGTARVLKSKARLGTKQGGKTNKTKTSPRGAVFIKTPSGGIPAATGTGPWTPGSATCKLCERYLDGSTIKIREVSPAVDITVYNTTSTAAGGSKLGQAKYVDGLLCVDVVSC